MVTALWVAVLAVAVLAWRVDRLNRQVKSLRASRDLHARVLSYALENAARGLHIVRVDTSRGLVWVAYDGLAGELRAGDALQKILVGVWTHIPEMSTPGQAVYRYAAPRTGAEQR